MNLDNETPPYQVLYDYNDVPTIRRFAQSDARFRNIMGPFGPLSNDTEYLTENGWRYIDSYQDGDSVAQYFPQTKLIEFIKPSEYLVESCTHFYNFRGIYLDMMLSDNHRMLWIDEIGKDYVCLAEDAAHVHWNGGFSGEIPNHFKIPESNGLGISEAVLRLTVAVIAEGSFHKDCSTNGCSMGFKKERKKIRIRKLLNECGVQFKETPYEDGRVYFYFQSPVKVKKFNKNFFSVNNNEARIILDELQNWDFHFSNGNTFQYSTTERESADFIQYCLASQGITANINIKDRGDGIRKLLYRLNVNENQKRNILYKSLDAVDYIPFGNGFKYCFKTSSGFFVARRNGRIFITGNSGKSTGCVQEIIRRAHLQVPGPDGIRRTRWAVVRNCYDDKTEVLTEKRGWKLFKDLLLEDRVASLVDGKELVFVFPTKYYSYPYDGKMIGFKNNKVDFLVTPEHNLYASMINERTKKMYGYKLHKAEDIYGMTHYKFKLNADEYSGGKTKYSVKMFEFLGFWFAEGSCGNYKGNKQIVITQKENEEYVDGLLKDCGFTYRKKWNIAAYRYNIHLSRQVKELIDKLLPCGKALTKYLPDWIKEAPREHLMAFLCGYEMGDGHTRTHKNDSTRLYTSSECLANDLQEIIFKTGGCSSVKRNIEKEREGSFKGQGFRFRLTVHQPNQYQPQTQKQNGNAGWYEKNYNGMVYCVEVPSHVVLVKRRNKIIWLGQSYGQLKDTTIKTFHDWYPPKIFGEWRVTDHTYLITEFPGVHCEVLFRALDRPDQVSNLLSLEVTGAWFNEVREIPRTIIEAMDSRIGRYPSKRDGGATWHGIIMDTNPPDEDSYLFKMFEKVRPEGWEIFKQPSGLSTMAENLRNLPPGYYLNLAKGKDEMYIRIYIHGQYGYLVVGSPVFLFFKDNIHVAPRMLDPLKNTDVLIGIDFGLQPACTIGQLTPLGQLRITDELVSDGMGIKQFCVNQLIPLLRKRYFGLNVMGFGDPSGISRMPTDEDTCFNILHSSEIGLSNITAAPTNAIVPRVGAVEGFINKMVNGEPGLIISPHVHALRKAMNGAYHYGKDPKGTGDEHKLIPVKNFASHVADSLEYLCLYTTVKAEYDVQKASFMSQMKPKNYQPASSEAGY